MPDPATPWLDADELHSWSRLAALLELLPSGLDAQLRRDSGLTHYEYVCLVVLASAEDRRLRMGDLALRTHATPPRLSRVVGRLEERGYVQRSLCPDDGRSLFAELTPVGVAALEQAAPGHVRYVREQVLDALTPEQVGQLGRICEALLGRLDPRGHMHVE